MEPAATCADMMEDVAETCAERKRRSSFNHDCCVPLQWANDEKEEADMVDRDEHPQRGKKDGDLDEERAT